MPENNDTILTLLLLSLNILLICTVWYSFLGEFASQTVFLCVVIKVDDALILCLHFFFYRLINEPVGGSNGVVGTFY